MKNILTWFSRKSHLNMLWFQMKLSHFDSPEPLSARIHLAFSFLQRGTCSVRAHIAELWAPTSGFAKPRPGASIIVENFVDQAPEHKPKISVVMSNGKSTERRILSILSYGILYTCFMFLFWRVTGHTAL